MKTWPDPVARHAAGRPDSPALITEERTWNWTGWDRWTSQVAHSLQGKKHVALCADESPDYLATLVGALRAGSTVVPLSTRWPEKMRREAISLVQPDRFTSDRTLLDTAKGGKGDGGKGRTGEWGLGREASVIFTSGSSGSSKAAVHTLGNHFWSATGVNEHVGLDADSSWLLNLPLYHVAGLAIVFRSLLAGSAIALPSSEMTLSAAIEAFRPTHLSLVGTQLVRLLRDPDADLSSVEMILLGGSRMPPGAVPEADERGLPLVLSYGLTEMASTVTAAKVGGQDTETSGRPLKYREVHISPESEILVRGDTLFKGYLTETGIEDPRDPDSWFATGDLGHFDKEGRLVVTGRKDLRIVSGGENVQIEAVEAALLRLPSIEEAVVVPVDDAEFGQRPFAFIRSSRAEGFDIDQIKKRLQEQLPRFAIPIAFERWEGSRGMKPDRTVLAVRAKETYESG